MLHCLSRAGVVKYGNVSSPSLLQMAEAGSHGSPEQQVV